MNKKQLNTLSASLSKALSPPSQIQPLPGIVSRAANTEPEQKQDNIGLWISVASESDHFWSTLTCAVALDSLALGAAHRAV
jgi:hypothetical protein